MNRILIVLLALAGALLPFSKPACGQEKQVPPPRTTAFTKYACPMRCEGDKTYDQSGTCPVCKMKLKPIASATASQCALSLLEPRESALVPGKEATFSFQLRPADAGAMVLEEGTSVDVFVVSADLSWFKHGQAKLKGDGRFSINEALPQPGRFQVFLNTNGSSPVHAGPVTITVPGTPAAAIPLKEDNVGTHRADDYEVSFSHAELKSGQKATVTYTISRDGQPVRDLQTYLGSLGHLIMVSETAAALVHERAQSSSANQQENVSASAGPTLRFDLALPSKGLYRGWLEFQHAGSVRVIPFVMRAS